MGLHNDFGKCIEDYELLHQLGKGGFASVYKARCRRTLRLVAIKMIDKKRIQSAGLHQRVLDEVGIHSRLQHRSVLQLYQWFQDGEHVYLILELADNGDLHRCMRDRRRPFTEPEAAAILRQVVEGLLYLHLNHIMHRDISLSNLLLSRDASGDMHVKIADFGLATQLQTVDERHLTMCGTPNYISPEVVSRSSHGLPADVWGVGCMFYTLLCGRPPFDTDAVQSTLAKVVMCGYHRPPDELSWEARDLIERLLQKNPLLRIELADVLRHAFMLRHGESGACAVAVGGASSLMTATPVGSSQSSSISGSTADSGIITFASSSSSSSRPPLQRSRSVDKFAQPLTQIYEQQDTGIYSVAASVAQHNYDYNSLNEFREKHQALAESSTPLPTSNRYFHSENEENHILTPQTNGVASYHHQQQQQRLPATPAPPALAPPKTERISVPPLNTARLLPTRQKTTNAIFSILRNGEVVVEFIKYKSKMLENRITDVCWISQDGVRIIIFQPDPGRGLRIGDEPPELPTGAATDCIFNYDNLPMKHWKKYVYASRFVNLVKGKSPKVTYFSALAKCQLMESMEDFEAAFYSGAKVTRSPSDGIKAYDLHGRLLRDDDHNDAAQAQSLRAHQEECLRHCLAVCSALELVQSSASGSCFPAVVGRRPVTEQLLRGQCISTATTTREHVNLAYSTPKSQQGSLHFSISTLSSLRNGSSASSSLTVPPHPQALAAQSNVPIKRINIPGIGTATELSHGIVHVQFLDGSLIAIIPATQGGGLTYTQSSGVSTHFAPHDDLPLVVREKLTQLPHVERELKTAAPLGGRGGRNGGRAAYDYLPMTTPKATVTNANNQHPMKFFR